jgi:hypothetical protein
MKKLQLSRALFVGLLVWLPSAWLHAADWMAVGLYEQGAFYIDRETMARTGSIRKVWTMLDYRQPQTSSRGIIRKWQPVPPQTPIAIIMANVCER